MTLPPDIVNFFKLTAAFFSGLWSWLSCFLFPSEKSGFFLEREYWLKVQQKVTSLLKEADLTLERFISRPIPAGMLEHLSDFAAGKTPQIDAEIFSDQKDATLLQALQKTQEAQFILSLVAEMNIGGLDKVFSPEEEKSADWVIFEKLFKQIERKTKIKREIFTYNYENYADEVDEKEIQYQFVMFGSKPNGCCVDYSIGMWDRAETVKMFVKCLSNADIPKERRDSLKKRILEFYTNNLHDPQINRFKREKKEADLEISALEKKREKTAGDYQIQFTDKQPEARDMQVNTIYAWGNEKKVHYALFNPDGNIRNSGLPDRDYGFSDSRGMTTAQETAELLQKEGNKYNDINNELSRNILYKAKIKNEILSGKDAEKLKELDSQTGNAWKEKIEKRRKELVPFYDDDAQFATFILKNLSHTQWWLSNDLVTSLFSAMPEGARSLGQWLLNSNQTTLSPSVARTLSPSVVSHNFYFSLRDPNAPNAPRRLHYLATNVHASRIVEIDDFEQLIAGKRYENRFKLCQTAEAHASYMNSWVCALKN